MQLELGKVKPKFFLTVGWSWASIGILGVLVGLLGIFSIPGILTLKRMILSTEEGFPPNMAEVLYPVFKWWIPAIITKFILSGALTYVSIMFIKGRRWAYLTLMGLNYVVLFSTVVGYFFSVSAFQQMLQKLQAAGVLEGTGFEIPALSVFHPLLISLLILFILPFVFFAWYFHWQPVTKYFEEEPSSS